MMVDSIASTSFIGHRPLYAGAFAKDVSTSRRRSADNVRFPVAEFRGRRIVMCPALPRLRAVRSNRSSINALAVELANEACSFMEDKIPQNRSYPVHSRLGVGHTKNSSINAIAVELAKEAYSFKEDRVPQKWSYPTDPGMHQTGTGIDRRPGLWPPENKADIPSLHNPLLRHERMGSDWLVAIFEWEGVLIEENPDLEKQAWLALSEEEEKSPPQAFILKRMEGMKSEQAISEVLCWSRDPAQMRRMAARKEDIYQKLQGGIYRLRDGSREFVNVLMSYKIPMALVSTRPRKTLEAAVGNIGIEEYFSVMIAAEDVQRGKPDPEMFVYAAQLLKFIPERCIVFGNSNQTVEAAHDARMKCVAVASKHPVYELAAADLVVRRLDELTVVDLKNLAAVESAEFEEPELELEVEKDDPSPSTRVTFDDDFW